MAVADVEGRGSAPIFLAQFWEGRSQILGSKWGRRNTDSQLSDTEGCLCLKVRVPPIPPFSVTSFYNENTKAPRT